MLNLSDFTEPQQLAVDRLYSHDNTLLYASMGLGKSAVTLTAISELIEADILSHVLVVAPLKVAKAVWKQEVEKWAHLKHLSVALCLGTESKRDKAVLEGCDITVVNFENLAWLMKKHGKRKLWDGLVVDELTKLKKVGGATFKALRPRLNDFSWRVGLTGTPVSEDFEGLYAMAMVVDAGAALGTRSDAFKRKYFFQVDYAGYDWQMFDWAASEILAKLSGIVYAVENYTDELPELKIKNIFLNFPENLRLQYEEIRKTNILDLSEEDEDEEKSVSASSAAVLSGKLQQLTSGFVYDEEGESVLISDFRLRALCSEIKALEGRAVVIVYWFKHDLEAIRALMPDAVVLSDDVEAGVKGWNDGSVQTLLLHPRSAGHGLSLQHGGVDMLWYSPVWSRDLWLQTIARVWRRGQTKPVTIHSLIARDTVDELVQARVENKADFEALWLAHFS